MKKSKKPSAESKSKPLRKTRLSIVGVGASAGGLEALRAFFGAFKSAPSHLSFVVVQHLSPQHRSMLVELIAHSTSLQVKELQDDSTLSPGVVYITPPNKDAVLVGKRIRLQEPHFKIGPKPSVDLFFKSLAKSFGENSIAVVLSGTGSDGAQGVREVKGAGGIVFCQTPSTARYDGMPKASSLTGAVDFELPPEQMAATLLRISKQVPTLRTPRSRKDADPYSEILARLKHFTGVDFASYKPNTIRRRIEHRMVATQNTTQSKYLDYLEATPEEPSLLYQDILISVTSFLRDEEFFKELQSAILKKLKAQADGYTFRTWVIGCATGEEAYSISMLIHDCAEKLNKRIRVQVFATDIDEHGLAKARRGVYSTASIIDVPKEWQERFFNLQDEHVQVKQFLREAVIFAKHNAIEDPPFLNLDLVSCRNVLIYFDQSLQSKIFQKVHYALNREGILFLGKSENIPSEPKFFLPTSRNGKVFARNSIKSSLPRGSSRSEANRDSALTASQNPKTSETTSKFQLEALIASLAPDSVLVNSELNILHVFGNAGDILKHPSGAPSPCLNRYLPETFRLELNILVQKCTKTGKPAIGVMREAKINRKSCTLQQRVYQLKTPESAQFLIAFDISEQKSSGKIARAPTHARDSKKLEDQLKETRENLQSIIEEQETSTEELQSLNEELQSANEELQSTNEELETANEELQSSNEELTTLNEEINVKSSELTTANLRLQAIQNAIIYPLVIVDNKLSILSFNPAARFLLRLSDSDVGAHLLGAGANFDLSVPVNRLKTALQKGSEEKFQFQTLDRNFEIQIQLVRDPKNAVDGAVVSFVENTEIIGALDQNKAVRKRLSDILDNTPAMVSMKDPTGVFVYVNRKYSELLKLAPEEIIGKTDEEIFGEAVGSQFREKDFEVIKKRAAIQVDEQVSFDQQNYWWTSSKFPLLDLKKKVQSVCTISLDITSRVSHEQQLELFKKAVASSGIGIIIFEFQGGVLKPSYVSDRLTARLGKTNLARFDSKQLLAEFFPSVDVSRLAEVFRELNSSKPFNQTLQTSRPDQVDSYTELRSFPLTFDPSSKYVVLSLLDVSEQITNQKLISAQQDELSKFNRYSAIAEISAGIAHEINTPLNVITTKTDLIRLTAKTNRMSAEKVGEISNDIDKTVKNISDIVLGLKSLTDRKAEQFEKLDLISLIADTLRMCEFRIQRSGIHLRTAIPTEPLYIRGIPIQLTQIMINLINNSVDAIKDQKDAWIEVKARAIENDGIEIAVTDSGAGIDGSIAEKVMTPFFTTKKDSKGTGIGLSLSRSIAQRHGGTLALDGSQKNTTFVLNLPPYSDSEESFAKER